MMALEASQAAYPMKVIFGASEHHTLFTFFVCVSSTVK